MNFQQLRIIREAARRDFNLTEVANALFTSQSGVSKHIKDLEDELGVEIFVRKGKRLLGLTAPGTELLTVVERLLLDADNIKRVADQYSARDEGVLSVATTHTQARYALPRVVTGFKESYPKVHLSLHQGGPREIVRMLLDGSADIGIASEGLSDHPDLAVFPFYRWHHGVVVPKGHPLEAMHPLTVEAIARYPIVTYQRGLTGRAKIDEAFDAAGIEPDIVMSALDSDIIKTYVGVGMGVGILALTAFNPAKDAGLHLLDDPQLFGDCYAMIAVRRGQVLRGFAHRFIELCNPTLTETRVSEEMTVSRG